MNSSALFHLKKPCEHRGVTLKLNEDRTVTINGQIFDTLGSAQEYLETIPRKDLETT